MRLHHVRLLDQDGLSSPRTVDLDAGGPEDRDANGLILSPGWLDLHAHLRDPGFPEKETLSSGAASAAFGGFTHVLAMANTDPVIDQPDRVRALLVRTAELPIRVGVVGAVTIGLEGRVLSDARALRAAGAVALSDDGRHAMDAGTLGRALRGAARAGLPVLIHAQAEHLGDGPDAEAAAVAQSLDCLAQASGARLHIQHVSTRAAVELIRAAKQQAMPVTAEVTPHHLALTADDVAPLGPLGNVNPPLRSGDDRAAVREALDQGIIDVIATDHAPHEVAAKAAGANGFHGFETTLGVLLGLDLDPKVLYRACVERPRQIISQSIEDEWILIDPDREWTVDPDAFKSRGKNTPFEGRRLRGRIVMTVCRGQIIVERMLQRV